MSARALALGISLLLCSASARAERRPIPHGTLELIAENQWIAAGHRFYLGLRFQLEPGWHIYWINPGDSGEPPRVQWQLPAGLTAGPMEWPAPRRLETASIVDFGYEDAVTLLIPILANTSLAAKQPVTIGAEVKLLVCREMCVPGKAQLSLTLPVKSEASAPNAQGANTNRDLFAATRKSLPRLPPRSWQFGVADSKDSFVLTTNQARQSKRDQVAPAIFFPLAESQIDNAAPQKFWLCPLASA
jgi:DsbC/DsbD-like thiol-disulfide interchange protein